MKGDFSRLRFSPGKNYTSVLKQQGRVDLDSDANEQCAIDDHLRDTTTTDVVGRYGGPVHDEGFQIGVASGAIQIGAGRYYVDGILCENRQALTYSQQPYLIDPTTMDASLLSGLSDGSIPVVQVHLEVWRRLVTALDDPCLQEPALGKADTTARLQTVWRVVAAAGAASQGQNVDYCALPCPPAPGPPGKLNVTTGGPSDCSCEPTPAAGYRGLENQLYRVEVHQGGDESSATFKWSRENASVVVVVNGQSGSQVFVDSLGFDANLGFAVGQWVEITDDTYEFGSAPNQPGDLYQIQSITRETLTVTMSQPVALVDPTKNARMRRWDQFGASATAAGIAVSPTALDLENGIQVQFSAGYYQPGDYWLIPARTATGEVEWPPCEGDGCAFQPAHRIEIFRAPLAYIQWDSTKGAAVTHDCRKPFYPLTELTPANGCGCCTRTVGDGVNTFGEYTSIQCAIESLPPAGGEVCILPGIYYENVRIVNRRDVVIHGCGWQTRVASSALNPNSSKLIPFDTLGAINPVIAVFTVVACRHIELRSFAVEAAAGEAGILLDGTGTSLSTNQNADLDRVQVRLRGVVDVAIEDLVMTAATYPAVFAERVQLLRVDRNRVAMRDVASLWSAIYVSGTEIHIDRNWVGVLSAATAAEWLPFSVETDLSAGSAASSTTASASSTTFVATEFSASAFEVAGAAPKTAAAHPGGIHIGGNSTDVYVIENEIEGGRWNGITLGGLELLDTKGTNTYQWTGVFLTAESDSCCTSTLLTSSTNPGTTGGSVVAGGALTNIQIHRNRIRNMGLCGIGPVGFFDLLETLEIITITGLNITGNAISKTLLREITAATEAQSNSLGYGAICVPDVQNVVIRDNNITDFGFEAGAGVCGIYILHGEMIEISRNHVIETRDWAKIIPEAPSSTAVRGGIFILLGTAPEFAVPVVSTDWEVTGVAEAANGLPTPVYQPGLPAVRVEHNVVRVPLSYALFILGLGPFTIANNHLSCGGMVRSPKISVAQTVLILNLGTSIEIAANAGTPSYIYGNAQGAFAGAAPAGFQNVSCGAVMFTGNICQLEATASRQREYASVVIFTPDHLIFSNNQCWLDSPQVSGTLNAFLGAGSLNVIGNRFQESPFSVYFSALTVGVVNITGENISTHCLFAVGPLLWKNNNIALILGTNQLLQTPTQDACTTFLDAVIAAAGSDSPSA